MHSCRPLTAKPNDLGVNLHISIVLGEQCKFFTLFPFFPSTASSSESISITNSCTSGEIPENGPVLLEERDADEVDEVDEYNVDDRRLVCTLVLELVLEKWVWIGGTGFEKQPGLGIES